MLIEFQDKICRAVSSGSVFKNPGSGTSVVKSITNDRIYYKRRSSTISIKFADLFNAYQTFKGSWISSADLKKLAPNVFDTKARPAGHDCNCTFLYLILQSVGLAGNISGSGVKGDPFIILLYDSEI